MSPTTPMTLTAVVLLLHQVREDDLTPQPWIALVALWMILGATAASLGNVAALIAWLIALGMIYANGKPLLDMLQKVTGDRKRRNRGRA